jgi:hypothetical protein
MSPNIWQLFDKITEFIVIGWCLAPPLAIFQLYGGVCKFTFFPKTK